MSIKTYIRSEERKKYNNRFSKAYKEFMLNFDLWFENRILWPYRYVTKVFWQRLGRALVFFKIGWSSRDWDHRYLHELMLFKLKRMKHNFIYHGDHSEKCNNYKPKMKSLNLTIKLLERYCDDFNDYYTKSYDKHNEKWGDLKCSTIPADIDEDGYVRTYSVKIERKNAVTEEEKEQERKEMQEALNKDRIRNQRDVDLIHKIIAKYHSYWWD